MPHHHLPTPLSLTLAMLSTSLASVSASPPLHIFVDPLIGTLGPNPGSAIAGGNSFPGASLPWGMAKPGIDTSYAGLRNGTAVDANAGFTPLGNVTAVSMMHVSGSGGAPTYGLISQMPLLGNLAGINLADNSSYAVNRSLALEAATVGLFETVLENGVGIEITAGNHTGFMRYTFPSMGNYTSATMDYGMSGGEVTDDINEDDGSDNVHVLVDLTHVLPAYSAMPYSQKFLRGDLHIRSSPSSSNQTIQPSYYGSATYTGGWSQPDEHTLFFCGNFSLPATSPLHPTSAHVQQKTANAVDGAGTFSWPYNPFQAPAFAARPSPRSFTDVKSYAGSGMGIGALFSWAHSRDAGGPYESVKA